MPDVIVYYVVGPVHPLNLQVLAEAMPGWTFRLCYESSICWLNNKIMESLPFEKVPLKADVIPDALWAGDVRAVIFSTAQARQSPINLLWEAMRRNVPTLAIEEVNQFALTLGASNNYVLPVDHILVASNYEQEALIASGMPAHRVQITGWPFFRGQGGTLLPEHKQAAKTNLGFNPFHPVVTLTLKPLGPAGETAEARHSQFAMVAQGLSSKYQLLIRPHPTANIGELSLFVAQNLPHSKVVGGDVPFEKVLAATDVLLNQGNSQVCIEALLCRVPVIILQSELYTLFHEMVPDLVVRDPDTLSHTISNLLTTNNPMRLYDSVISLHIPYSPAEALTLTAHRVADIASAQVMVSDRNEQWLSLAFFQAWQPARDLALRVLSEGYFNDLHSEADSLGRLIRYCASRDDLHSLKMWTGDSFLSHVLRCLWIDQLIRRRERPAKEDLAWMSTFPPISNIWWFERHTALWAWILIHYSEDEVLSDLVSRLKSGFRGANGIGKIVCEIEGFYSGFIGQVKYLFALWFRDVRFYLRPLKHIFQSFLRDAAKAEAMLAEK